MEQRDWQGVFPAITTPFLESFEIDHARMAKNVAGLVDALPLESVRQFEAGRDGLTETLTLIRERLAVRPTLS
jgi:dihydrodipicolinate synthase/N-acetylneuraminate lyase